MLSYCTLRLKRCLSLVGCVARLYASLACKLRYAFQYPLKWQCTTTEKQPYPTGEESPALVISINREVLLRTSTDNGTVGRHSTSSNHKRQLLRVAPSSRDTWYHHSHFLVIITSSHVLTQGRSIANAHPYPNHNTMSKYTIYIYIYNVHTGLMERLL